MPSVKREAFEKRVVIALSHADDTDFLNGVEDVSQYVTGDDEVQVIHRSYLGVKPDVLINNSTYPIPEQALDDEDIPIILDKYQTKVTPVTDDQLYASTYDQLDAVNRSHVTAITERRFDKAIHALAPAGNTVKTPVILTTGEADPETGRKKLTKKDIIAFRRALGKKFRKGWRLVLCSDHTNDILEWDEHFDKQYADRESGMITKKYGFEIYEYAENPYYTIATKAKLAFGAIPDEALASEASVAFYAPRAVKASGKTKAYFSASSTDPARQRNTMNYRTYHIAMPTGAELIGALVSGK